MRTVNHDAHQALSNSFVEVEVDEHGPIVARLTDNGVAMIWRALRECGLDITPRPSAPTYQEGLGQSKPIDRDHQ